MYTCFTFRAGRSSSWSGEYGIYGFGYCGKHAVQKASFVEPLILLLIYLLLIYLGESATNIEYILR